MSVFTLIGVGLAGAVLHFTIQQELALLVLGWVDKIEIMFIFIISCVGLRKASTQTKSYYEKSRKPNPNVRSSRGARLRIVSVTSFTLPCLRNKGAS
ncbi:MAG: hypothetical protein HC903_01255 [Methylacidiphilales bacterium]|nr:hypothetical protein [Candidatus Methylacidiphilales bacterium]